MLLHSSPPPSFRGSAFLFFPFCFSFFFLHALATVDDVTAFHRPAFSSPNPDHYPANICSHLFSVPFLKRAAASNIPYHIARKSIAQVHPATGKVSKAPGIKLERFIFDAFELATKVVTLQVPRALEFAPVSI